MEPTEDLQHRTDELRDRVNLLLAQLRRKADRASDLPAGLTMALDDVALLLEIQWIDAAASVRLQQLLHCLSDNGPDNMESRLGFASRTKLVGSLQNCVEMLGPELDETPNDTDEADVLPTVAMSSAAAETSPSPATVRLSDRFEVEAKPFARGGMGAVFHASDHQYSPPLKCVIKICEAEAPVGMKARFQLEQRAAAEFSRDNCYARGEAEDGRLFYAMRYFGGHTLREIIDAYHGAAGISSLQPTISVSASKVASEEKAAGQTSQGQPTRVDRDFELRRLVGYLASVAEAVERIHSLGIIHRDLKPANIKVDDNGDVHVLDFGLVKDLNAEDDIAADEETPLAFRSNDLAYTQTGQTLGTIAYMAPEQALGSPKSHDCATDVYALGAMLYHIVTGKNQLKAIDEKDVGSCLRRIADGEVPSAASTGRGFPELQAICNRAMSTEPSERHHSAREFREELQLWLAGRVVPSYRATLSGNSLGRVRYDWHHWRRSHQTLYRSGQVFVAVTLLVLLTAAGLSVTAKRRLARRIEVALAAAEPLMESAKELESTGTLESLDAAFRTREQAEAVLAPLANVDPVDAVYAANQQQSDDNRLAKQQVATAERFVAESGEEVAVAQASNRSFQQDEHIVNLVEFTQVYSADKGPEKLKATIDALLIPEAEKEELLQANIKVLVALATRWSRPDLAGSFDLELMKQAKQYFSWVGELREDGVLTHGELLRLRDVHKHLGEEEEFAKVGERLATTAPKTVFDFLMLAEIARDDRDLKTAQQWYEKALKKDPVSFEANLGLGFVYENQGDSQTAFSHLNTCFGAKSESYQVLKSLADTTAALAANGLGSVEQKVRFIDLFVKLYPNKVSGHVHQGWHDYNIERNKEAALEHFKQALDVAERWLAGEIKGDVGQPSLAFTTSARVLIELKRADEAADILKRHNTWLEGAGELVFITPQRHFMIGRSYAMLAKSYSESDEPKKAEAAAANSLRYLKQAIETCKAHHFYQSEKIQPIRYFDYFVDNEEFGALNEEAKECLEQSRGKSRN